MNKKINKLLLCIFLCIILFELFDHSNVVKQSILDSSKLWFYNLVPSIFPIYLFIDICLNYQILDYLCKFLNSFMDKFFKVKKECSFIFLLSMLCGFPSNSKYIKNAIEENYIDISDINKILVFTHFSNPLFIIESIGISFLHNKKIGIIILISHYLGNFILGFINRNSYCNFNNINKFKEKKKNSFITTLSNSINNTFSILILLYGIITFFMIITSLISINLNLNPLINSIICGLLEITNGIKNTSNLSIPLIYKGCLITFFLSFGGFCIHMQVFSILKDYNINYKNYLIIRIIHGLCSTSIFYLIMNFV